MYWIIENKWPKKNMAEIDSMDMFNTLENTSWGMTMAAMQKMFQEYIEEYKYGVESQLKFQHR